MYKYKLQWIFHVGYKERLKEVFKIIDILGAKSLDVINFLTADLKRVDLYDSFISYPHGLAEVETKKAIKKYLKKTYSIGNKNNLSIEYIELIRK